MRVEATRIGYYGNKRIREGQQFNLKNEKDFSKEWMISLDSKQAKAASKDKTKKFVDVSDPEPVEDVI
jgi:hypothetical protein